METNIESAYKSNHSPVVLKMCFQKKQVKSDLSGNLKLLLGDINYERDVKKTFDSIKNRYALPVYNHENTYNF